MQSFNAWFATATAVICACGCVFVYGQGKDGSQLLAAQAIVNSEIKQLKDQNNSLEKQKNEYLETIDAGNALIKENEDKNSVLTSYSAEISDYESKIAELDKQLASAKAEKEALSGYAEGLSNVSNQPSGEAQKLAPGTYLCPSQLAAGRYRLSGSGMFRIVNARNSVIESQDLSKLDGNSYTFNLDSDSRLISEGEDMTLTPMN